ncbi:extracellular calcium-sensing receptor-like [Rhinatrema bivittatum]|uniref:extracellular calcium-sensing receptor-like n=1 Tax=Rhinatrema bivittatum TaxID=194408 RepID=UPI00112D8A65|nr:extracellular calcium-sensing receptor-like [Rhinatrema bivittatum]
MTSGCKLELREMTPVSMDGDFLLGVISANHARLVYPILTFRETPRPARCENFQVRYYRDTLAILFAIEEINQNQYLLLNHTLGYQILDSCASEVWALQGTLQLLSGGKATLPNYRCEAQLNLAGILGERSSSMTEVMARITGVYRIPQISFAAQHPMLSEKHQFPSFLRTIPADTLQPQAIAKLLLHFNWTWVGILSSNSDSRMLGSQKIWQEVVENGGCVAFMEKIDDRYPSERQAKVAEVIRQSSVSVIVCNCYGNHLKPILELLSLRKVINMTWVFSSGMNMNPNLFTMESWRLLNGSMVFISSTSNIANFTNFLYHMGPSAYPWDIFTKLFWEKAFGCKWEGQNVTYMLAKADDIPCLGKEDLKTLDPTVFQLNDLSITYHAYLAIYAYAYALHNMMLDGAKEDIFHIRTNIQNIKYWQVLHYLRDVHFTTMSEQEVYFDVNGDVPTVFDIKNIQIKPDDTIELITVGRYDSRNSPGEEITLNISAILWNQRFNQTPRSVCSESCPIGYRKSARLGQPSCCFDCVPCSAGEIANETDTTKCLKCPEDHRPNESRDKCLPKIIEFLSYQDTLGAALAAVAIILSLATILILTIFFWFKDTPILFICTYWISSHPSFPENNTRSESGKIIVECNDGLTILFYCMLGYMGFLAIISFIVAFLARTLPDSFNEAKFITFSMLVFVSVWLSFIPAYLSTQGKYMVAVEIFAILSSGAGMLGYMGFLAIISFIVAFLARKLPDSFNEAKFITFSMLVFVSVWLSFIPAYLRTQGKYMVAVENFAILSSGAGLLLLIFLPNTVESRGLVKENEVMRIFRWLTLTLLSLLIAEATTPGCKLELQKMTPFSKDGDIVLGVISAVHSGVVYPVLDFREKAHPAHCEE